MSLCISLPRIDIESGETRGLDFHLVNKNGTHVEAQGKTATLYVYDYINRFTAHAVSKAAVIEGQDGSSYIRVELGEEDTSSLLGKYFYEINIKDLSDGSVEILRGILIAHGSADHIG